MAVGTARRLSQGCRRRQSLAKVITLLMLFDGPFAASAAPAQEPVQPPALTPDCAVPESDIAVPAPLPNIVAQLHNHAPIRILAIGSSSTSGVGASSQVETYPSWLDVILAKTLKGVPIDVVNRGIPGELAETTADRIMNEVSLSKPNLVLWQLGTNDALARVPPEDFEATVLETVRWLKSQNIDVVLVGLQYVPRFAHDPAYIAIRRVLHKVAAEEDILYVHRYEAMQFMEQKRVKEQIMAPDQFHLNDLGYRCMAEHVAHAMIISLLNKPPHSAND